MFKILLVALAFCACASLTSARAYGPSYSAPNGVLGVPVALPLQPGIQLPTALDYVLANQSPAISSQLLQLAVAQPQPQGPLVGNNYAYQIAVPSSYAKPAPYQVAKPYVVA